MYINVYDLMVDGKPLKHLNDLALPLGFGAFHSGLGEFFIPHNLTCSEIFGMEISFSRSEGIFLSPPRQCYGAVFRKCLKIGPAKISESLLKAHLLSMM